MVTRHGLTKWSLVAALTLGGMVSAQAWTCADVRALSAEQQAFYIKVYNITQAQQDRIRAACYGTAAQHANPAEASKGQHTAQRVARAE
jgi:hypothetical protein